jgi:hypothetical protein
MNHYEYRLAMRQARREFTVLGIMAEREDSRDG